MKAFRFLRALPLATMLAALTLGGVTPSPAAQGTGCLPTTGTVSGLTFAQGINAAIAALISGNSGASPPATDCSAAAVKGQTWLDTSVTPNVMRQYDGTAWVVTGALDATNHLWAPPVGGGGATLTAAATTDLWANPAAAATISGTTTIAALANASAVPGTVKMVTAAAAFRLTHNANSLELPSGTDIVVAAGDRFLVLAKTPSNVAVFAYTRADGTALVNPSVPLGTVLYGTYGNIPSKTVYGAGQALSRAAYPDYAAAVSRTQSGTLTAGGYTIASVANTAGLGNGMPIEGTGILPGTLIAAVTSSSIQISQAAQANGAQSVTVFPTGYGRGGDSTTVGVTDCRGRTLAGRDDALIGAANRLTAAYFGAATGQINSAGGADSHVLTGTEMPSHAHSNSLNDPGHAHAVSSGIYGGTNQTTGVIPGGGNVYPVGNGAVTVNPSGTGITISNAAAGGGAAHSIVMPTVIAECVVSVLK